MKLFNGCNMGISRFFRVNYLEGADGAGDSSKNEKYDKELSEFTNKIKSVVDALTNGTDIDDNKAKIEGQELINKYDPKKLDASFVKYLKENPEKLEPLKKILGESLQKIVDKFKKDNDGNIPVELNPLLEFAKSVGIQLQVESGSVDEKKDQVIENNDQVDDKKNPELTLKKTDFEGNIKEGSNQEFFKGKNEEVGINEKVDGQNESKLDITKKNIEELKNQIKNIDLSKLSEDVKQKIDELQELLGKISNVLGNVIPENVKILQGFISDNLTGNDKDDFDVKSKKSDGTFDGKFGSGTLEGLDKVLANIKAYIGKVSEGLTQTDDSAGSDDAKKKEKGKENPDNKEEQVPLDTNPLKLGDNKYQVMKNSQIISQNAKLNGATFYFGNAFTGKEPTEGQSWNPVEAPTNGQDYKCYMKLEGNGKSGVFEVMLDKNGNLCPIMKQVGGNGEKILIKDNESCKKYLASKIPDGLPGNPKIAWNDSMKDYVIRSQTDRGQMGLTVEPITMDGNWVVEKEGNVNHLSQSLILLNFTNFLRGNFKTFDQQRNFKNDNPDLKLDNGNLYVRVSKSTRGEGRWYKIDKSQYGLSGLSEETLKKFIKYNNHEDWEDNWDKKKNNRDYNKVNLSNIPLQTNIPRTPTEQPTVTPVEKPKVTPAVPTVAPVEQPATPVEQPKVTPVEKPKVTPAEQQTVTPVEQPKVTPVVTGETLEEKSFSPQMLQDILNPAGGRNLLFFDADRSKLKIGEIDRNGSKDIVLTNGKFNIIINDIFNGSDFCGANNANDKIKISYLALSLHTSKVDNLTFEKDGDKLVMKFHDYMGYNTRDKGVLSQYGITESNFKQFEQYFKRDMIVTSVETPPIATSNETLDEKSLDINDLNTKVVEALKGIPDIKPETINKIKIIKESDGSGEYMTFVNGAHGVNINIDGLLSDEKVFGNAKIEDKMKLLFIASWEFGNNLKNIDSISYNLTNNSELMLLKNGDSYNYVNLSNFGLDRSIAEKFFSNYANLVSKFKKVDLSQTVVNDNNESRVDASFDALLGKDA